MFRIVRKKRNHDFPTSRKVNLNIKNKNNPTSGLLKMKIDILFYHGDQQLNKCDPWNIFFWVVKNPFTFIVHTFQDVISGQEWPWRHIVTLSLKNVISSHQHYFLHDIEENNIINISYYSNVVFLFDIVTPLYTMKKSVASDTKSRTILHKHYRWSGVWYDARISTE